MKIAADTSVCIGAGVCESIAPSVFEVGAAGEVDLLRADIPPELEDAVREAVESCPTQALRIES